MRIRWGFFCALFFIIHSSAEAIDRIRIAVSNPNMPVPEDGLRLVIEQARKSAKINREISPSEVADLALLREVQSEIGTRRR